LTRNEALWRFPDTTASEIKISDAFLLSKALKKYPIQAMIILSCHSRAGGNPGGSSINFFPPHPLINLKLLYYVMFKGKNMFLLPTSGFPTACGFGNDKKSKNFKLTTNLKFQFYVQLHN